MDSVAPDLLSARFACSAALNDPETDHVNQRDAAKQREADEESDRSQCSAVKDYPVRQYWTGIPHHAEHKMAARAGTAAATAGNRRNSRFKQDTKGLNVNLSEPVFRHFRTHPYADRTWPH